MSNERASFTAGPWSQYHDDPLVIVNANGSSLGEASAGDPFISYSEQLANARLIAAAPDLLAALEYVCSYRGEVPTHIADVCSIAIAAAKGKA